ncbi:MAG: hypothetical protein E7A62_02065 [Actinomycetaceae bacterium]|nr:hypothetical protein [Actinomycetaceae bacterium]
MAERTSTGTKRRWTRRQTWVLILALVLCACCAWGVATVKNGDPDARETAQYLVNTGKLKGKVEDVTVGPKMKEFHITSAARVGCNVFFTVPRDAPTHDRFRDLPFAATDSWEISPYSWKGNVGVSRDPQCRCGFTTDDTDMIAPPTFDEVDPALKKGTTEVPENSPLLAAPCGFDGENDPEAVALLKSVPTGWAAVHARWSGKFD